MVLYFWQNDSKDASDRAFGQVCTALRTASVVGIDELASEQERIRTAPGSELMLVGLFGALATVDDDHRFGRAGGGRVVRLVG